MANALKNIQTALLRFLTRRRQETAYVLFALAVSAAAFAGWIGYQHGLAQLPLCIWGGTLALVFLALGIWRRNSRRVNSRKSTPLACS